MLEAVAIRGEDVWEARPLLDAGQAPQAAGDSWLGTGSDGSSGCEAGIQQVSQKALVSTSPYAESEPGGGHKPLPLRLCKVVIPNDTRFPPGSFFFEQNNNLTRVQAVKKILRGAQFRRIFSRLKQMW